MLRPATSEGWFRSLAAVIAAVVAVLVPVMRTASAEPQGASVSAAAAGEVPATMTSELGPGGLRNSTTRNRNRRLYHYDVTKEGVPCKRNPLLDREVDPANYEFGCGDIKVPPSHLAECTELRRVLARTASVHASWCSHGLEGMM